MVSIKRILVALMIFAVIVLFVVFVYSPKSWQGEVKHRFGTGLVIEVFNPTADYEVVIVPYAARFDVGDHVSVFQLGSYTRVTPLD